MKINEKDLKEIFEKIKYSNEKEGYEKLYNTYEKLIYSIAFSILKNKEDGEDVVQAVFTKLYNLEKEKLPDKNCASWLYSVTKNEAISILRKNKNNIDLDSIYEIEDKNDEINEKIDEIEFNNLIRGLDIKEKEVVSLKILSDLSFDEISKLLNEPTSTIKWRYYKSINSLKLLISNLGMTILTFVIGIKTLFNKKELISNLPASESKVKEETKTQTNETESKVQEENETKSILQDITRDEKETKEEIIVENTPINDKSFNPLGIGILGISGIFFILTTIFLIFSIKYQLKRKSKTSK